MKIQAKTFEGFSSDIVQILKIMFCPWEFDLKLMN